MIVRIFVSMKTYIAIVIMNGQMQITVIKSLQVLSLNLPDKFAHLHGNTL